jgi:hypothetical protein
LVLFFKKELLPLVDMAGRSTPLTIMANHQEKSNLFSSTLIICFFAAILEGLDLQSAGVAATRLGPALHLGSGQLGIVFRTPFKTSDTKLVGISMNMQGL